VIERRAWRRYFFFFLAAFFFAMFVTSFRQVA
jgi:hypothetical protein